jgi:hypothetical protein
MGQGAAFESLLCCLNKYCTNYNDLHELRCFGMQALYFVMIEFMLPALHRVHKLDVGTQLIITRSVCGRQVHRPGG